MAFFSSQQLKFLPSFCKASAGAFWPWEQNFSLRSHLKLLHFQTFISSVHFKNFSSLLYPQVWNQRSAMPHPSPCSWDWSIQALLYGNHIFLPLQWLSRDQCTEIQHVVLGGIYPALSSCCGWSLAASASWNHHSWGFDSGILYFHGRLTPRCHQKAHQLWSN